MLHLRKAADKILLGNTGPQDVLSNKKTAHKNIMAMHFDHIPCHYWIAHW
jgi:hypothetical protein